MQIATKKCTKCGIEKELIYFPKKGGQCKDCCAKKKKEYYENNKEEIKGRSKVYRENNREELKTYHKEYYQNNKEKFKQYREDNKEEIKVYQQEYNKEYYENNKEEIKENSKVYRENNKEKIKEYQENNKEEIKEQKKEYRENNKKEIKAYQQEYRKNNKEKRNKSQRDRRKNDIFYRLRMNVSRAINKAINGCKNNQSCLKCLPFTIDELKEHIERQFLKPGNEWMNWNNHGLYDPKTYDERPTWQLDHWKPQSDFPYTSMEDDNFKKCWALDNLRPLGAKENVLDGVNRTRHKKD